MLTLIRWGAEILFSFCFWALVVFLLGTALG